MYPTDKSGKLAIMTPEVYREAAEVRTRKDIEVDYLELKKVEKESNLLMEQLSKVFKLGSQHNQTLRMKQAFRSVDNPPPATYFLIKDHKTTLAGAKCPPTRPVCGATDGPLARLQNLVSKPLQLYANEYNNGTKCDSSENLIRAILDTNKKIEKEKISNVLVLSMDVKALYPSLEQGECCRIIEEVVRESEVDIVGVDWREMALFLVVTLGKEEMELQGLSSARM